LSIFAAFLAIFDELLPAYAFFSIQKSTKKKISELTDCQLAHIAAIIDDIRGTNNKSG